MWIVGLVANEPAAFLGPVAFAQCVAISTAAYCVLALVLLFADRVPGVHRLQGLWSYLVIAAIVIVAAELRLTVFVIGFDVSGLPNDVSLTTRVVSSALIALIGYGYAAVALESWARYCDERDELFVSLIATSRRVEGHDATVSAMSAILRQSMQGHLARARPEIARELDALKAALAEGHDGKAEFERVHAITDDRWRSISADVWSQATAPVLRPGWREFATTYALTKPFSLTAVAMGGSALAFLVFGRALDAPGATAALALWLSIAAGVSIATNAIARGLPHLAVAAVGIALTVLLCFPGWLVMAGVLAEDDTALLVRIGAINVNVVAVLVLAGASPAMARNRHAVLSSLRRRRDRTSVHQLQVESRLLGVAQELAATLHGSSRSSFMAAALRLEAALDRGDRLAALELVEDLRRTILEAEDSLEHPRVEATAEDISDVIENWRSLCDVDVDGSWCDVPPALVPAAHTVVVEAISDAMRHGDCSQISIALKPSGSGIELSVTNNGVPLSTSAQAGLGTALLDRLAPGGWSRRRDADGRTRLTVLLSDAILH